MAETIEVPAAEYISLLKVDFAQDIQQRKEEIRELQIALAKAAEWETKYYKQLRSIPTCPCNKMTGAVIEFSGTSRTQTGCCVECGKRYRIVEDQTESEV
jgi:hypothetical protein